MCSVHRRHANYSRRLAGLQRVQHHDAVKVGCIYGMTEKTNLQEWSDRLTKLLFQALNFKPLISLQTKKIIDGSYCKASGFKIIYLTKPKNMIVHAEIIGLQKMQQGEH